MEVLLLYFVRYVHGYMKSWPNVLGGRTEHTSKQRKMATFAGNCSVKMTFRLFNLFSVVMTMVSKLLRKFGISVQIKKSIANAPCVL